IESGERKEISLGYKCQLDPTPGTWNGESYDAVQKNIVVNHVALGPKGWGGTSGLSGKIYSHGLIFLYSYLGIVVSRLLVAFFIAPKMEKFLGLTSAGDIFEKLYGKHAKILVGALTS